MSAFQVTVTPTRLKNKKRLESREPTFVMMAPFSAKAIVQFEDVPVTKTAKRILKIINPSDECIEVKVTKSIQPEHNIAIDWTERTVPAQDEIAMEMVWSPQIEVACKETLQLTDNRNFRKDIMVILKSKSNKPTKTVRKFPSVSSGVSSHGKTLHLKSPTSGAKAGKSVFNKRQNDKLSQAPHAHMASPKVHQAKKATLKKAPAVVETSPLSERNVYLGRLFCSAAGGAIESPLFDLGSLQQKENISPVTPSNIMNLIDKLNFTPAKDTVAKMPAAIDDLASLPTPVGSGYLNSHELREEIRPRRLTAVELLEPGAVAELSETRIVNNKTFDVKRNDGFNGSTVDATLEESLVESGGATYDAVIVNHQMLATPHGRALTMIQEEESNTIGGCKANFDTFHKPLDNTYNKRCLVTPPDVTALKRDVNLVATPLRKHSESMMELSVTSPQSKNGIQGSLPNLNEMECLRSIEHNRYFYQSNPAMPAVRIDALTPSITISAATKKQPLGDDSPSASNLSVMSNVDLIFNQNDILAQSSRFNLNEVGMHSRRNSPKKAWHHATLSADGSPCSPTHKSKKQQRLKNPDCGCRYASSHKRKSHELSFSDSPSCESIGSAISAGSGSQLLKPPPSTSYTKMSPPKRQRVDGEFSFARPTPTSAAVSRSRNWSLTQPKKLKLAKTLALVKKPITPRKIKDAPRVMLYDTDLYMQACINPDPFAATTTCDPFLASTMYLDERAVDRHQTDFKKWLNALVSIPAELATDCNAKIDVGRLFNEVRHKDLQLAPTKEAQSMTYLTHGRLECLRRAAVQLYLSDEMRVPCSKVVVYVNKHAVRMRSDRNLHLDVVLQRYILELLLCFNPLWLRLGLEVIYGEKIHLNSNGDVVGLSTFILNRLFRDKFLEQKYSKAYTLSEEYADHIKKFTLQKMLLLLLFLDRAKEARIIKHNPCLFVKKSPHKETKDILLKFSSELLANIGDITRDLRRLGYVLGHRQTFLDEFDYAFNNLASDLRDGIRLTRVMEIILLRDDLSRQLRVPAISRLQRIYNVNLGLQALRGADFQLRGEITAADIVDGHREKTLSLLWQLIYKFRSPKFHAAARVLQQWWQRKWLAVLIRRRIRQREECRRIAAATKIQAAFRGHVTRKFAATYRDERSRAAVVLQKHVRRHLAQRRLCQAIGAATLLQRWFRAERSGLQCRLDYLRLRNCTVFVQRRYRCRLLSKKLLSVANVAFAVRAQRRVQAACLIQSRWRAHIAARHIRADFLRRRHVVIQLQRRYRAKRAAQAQRAVYMRLRRAAIMVQRRLRARRLMRSEREQYERLRACAVKLQTRRRATLQMRVERANYAKQRAAAVRIQTWFRATRAMWRDRAEYRRVRATVCQLQRRYRGRLDMRQECRAYEHTRLTIVRLQRRWRATRAMRQQRCEYLRSRTLICQLQRCYRARLAMRRQRAAYEQTRAHIVHLQRRWRATILARRLQHDYNALRRHVVVLQQKWRARKVMREQRAAYLRLRAAAVCLQTRYRAHLQMRHQREQFQRQRRAALVLQGRWRAYKQMRFDRAKYRGVRAAVCCLQQHWRAHLKARCQRKEFLRQQRAAVVLQHAYRARRAMLSQSAAYKRLRAAAVVLQRRYRAATAMRQQAATYQRQRQLLVGLQRRYRAKLLARCVRNAYARQRTATVQLQRRYRARLAMRREQSAYAATRLLIVRLQRRWRATLAMRRQKAAYQRQRQAAAQLQCWYRSLLAARAQRQAFLRQRAAAVVLQRHYRARAEMRVVRGQFLLIRSLIVCVQRKYRARRAMLTHRQDYVLLRQTVLHLQQKHRGRSESQRRSAHFQLLRTSTLSFQSRARGYLARQRFQALMTPEMVEYLRQKRAAKIIQRFWRGYRVRKRFHGVRIAVIRQNIAALRSTSKAVNSIRNKLHNAVHLLRGRFNISEALHVLTQLERLSRTVPHLLMGQSEFISSFCYGIMAQAIRSEVDKQLIESCSCVILNLARYNSTTANTFQRGGLTTIAQMLLRWCDKDTNIFNTLCTLIWVFAHCPQKREIIHNFMTTTEAIYFVRETKKLVARKEKMKQNVRNPNPLSFPYRSGGAQQQFSSRALPGLDPDYGIIRNKPYTFLSSVYAFDTLLWKLGIQLY